jgi:hypothetical protein
MERCCAQIVSRKRNESFFLKKNFFFIPVKVFAHSEIVIVSPKR